jgi:hypothetical protein
MIQKSRDTIKKQIDTFKGALKNTSAYGVPAASINQSNKAKPEQQMSQAIATSQAAQQQPAPPAGKDDVRNFVLNKWQERKKR